MHLKKRLCRMLSLALCGALLMAMLPATASAGYGESPLSGFAGKKLSVFGDSISTYIDYSNGTAAQTTNSTITDGAVYYPRSGFSVSAQDTWWYQAAQLLDMELLVNNSWSGSCLLKKRSGTAGAYADRCVQLHDDTGVNAGQEPDIIAIFLGTNDYYAYPSTLGSYEAVDFDSLISRDGGSYTYAAPATSMEAYALCLHKISLRYPNAEVYCFTLFPQRDAQSERLTAFNEDICQLAAHFGAYIVDLYDCGVQYPAEAFDVLMGDALHPDVKGMDAVTNAFLASLYKNSKYMKEDVQVWDVSWSLKNIVAEQGTTKAVLGGQTYSVDLTALEEKACPYVTVTMGGQDITDSCYADGRVSIASVTGSITITAKAVEAPSEPEEVPQIQRELTGFRWEYDEERDQLVNVTSGNLSTNPLTTLQGSVSGGQFVNAQYALSQTVYLNHDVPWRIEWKSAGSWGNDGGLLFAEGSSSDAAGGRYLYRRNGDTMLALGEFEGGFFHNYAIDLAGTGIDNTQEHVYLLTNKLEADGTNSVILYVDGKKVGPLDQYYNGAVCENISTRWLSGKNFQFNYIGTTPHTITDCTIDYIQVWENGLPEQKVIDFYGANMTMGASLSMNFFIAKDDLTDPGCYVEITKEYHNGQQTVVKKIPYTDFAEQGDLWKVTFDGIAPKEMTDRLTVKLFLEDGTCVSNPYSTSIRDYAMLLLESEKASQSLKEMVEQMLRYGGCSQLHFSYHTDDLADSRLK